MSKKLKAEDVIKYSVVSEALTGDKFRIMKRFIRHDVDEKFIHFLRGVQRMLDKYINNEKLN